MFVLKVQHYTYNIQLSSINFYTVQSSPSEPQDAPSVAKKAGVPESAAGGTIKANPANGRHVSNPSLILGMYVIVKLPV